MDTSCDDGISELPSSKLGTQQYWDDIYSKELENFDDSKDEGEIWFGHSRMKKLVKWMVKNENIKKYHSILDIGCGNGVLLLELADEGFTDLWGVDYSSNGIKLARSIASEHEKDIQYEVIDFLSHSSVNSIGDSKKFDVCHDKGTYDAISLRADDAKTSRRKYIENLRSIMCEGAYFIITSCNWTLDELKQHFCPDFKFICDIPAPTFQYGGQSGSVVSTAVFVKLCVT